MWLAGRAGLAICKRTRRCWAKGGHSICAERMNMQTQDREPSVATPSDIARMVAPGIADIHPYEPGKPIPEVEREYGITNVIKLASNENPLGPSPKAIEAVRRALPELHLYPDGASFYLRRRLAAFLGVHEDEIILGAGSNEIIDLLVRTFCSCGDEVVVSRHTFVCYQLAAQAHGRTFREVERGPRLAYDVDAILRAITPRTRFVFLANPDNPTGVYAAEKEMGRLLRELPPHVVLAVDEAYHEYVRASDYLDLLQHRQERKLLVLLRTFSKIYGLAGLRCGYGIAPAEMVGFLHRVRTPFNVNALAQAGALAAIDDIEHVRRAQANNAAGMEQVTRGLEEIGIAYIPSQANFVLIDVSPHQGREVFHQLLLGGVIVRPVAGYQLPQYLRVTIGTPAENTRFLARMRTIFA